MSNKNEERIWVEEAARILGEAWHIQDSESPDFIIKSGDLEFGLEVTEVHIGQKKKNSSIMRSQESLAQKVMKKLQDAYEAHTNVPLRVQLIINKYNECLNEKILPILIAEDFGSKLLGHRIIQETLHDHDIGIKFYATKAIRAEYIDIRHKVGWVQCDETFHLEEAILKKAKLLPAYRKNSGSDVRLLIVANRLQNSGKLVLKDLVPLNGKGFDVIYFFSFPESVTVFGSRGEVVPYVWTG